MHITEPKRDVVIRTPPFYIPFGAFRTYLCRTSAPCRTTTVLPRHRYDDLRNYENERSAFLLGLRDRVEGRWQRWELGRAGGVDGEKEFKGTSVEEVRVRMGVGG